MAWGGLQPGHAKLYGISCCCVDGATSSQAASGLMASPKVVADSRQSASEVGSLRKNRPLLTGAWRKERLT
ncbi:Hypothetical predicted protein [Podarcis lilfordi]|uniref:Uncharacterized protein n=1 Tax=Podarcis lilfordi TaxID=74358 RepID=A0AA35P8V6_9SAUR|nr:Hypothetical predicted protein [Podarcis lilfordi]